MLENFQKKGLGKFTGEKDWKSAGGKRWKHVQYPRHSFRNKSGRAEKVPELLTPHCKDAKTPYWKYKYSCERFIYFQDRSVYSAAGKYLDRFWEYINRSQTHECGNWNWGREIPFLGIRKWDFRCSAVQYPLSSLSKEATNPFIQLFDVFARRLYTLAAWLYKPIHE